MTRPVLPALLALVLASGAGALLPGARLTTTRLSAAGASAHVTSARGRRRHPLPWKAAGRRRAAAALRAQVDELLRALVAELRTGADARAALLAAASGLPMLETVARAASVAAGDPAGALRAVGGAPGGSAAADLAVAWQLAEATGARLTDPVSRLHDARRAEDRLDRELTAALAGPRATARLLGALPVVGVAMGAGLGADPLGFLVGTPPGRVCLLVGLVLIVVGLRWTAVIVGSVTRSGRC